MMRSPGLALYLLLATLCVTYANVVFLGGSLVASENYNPTDFRLNADGYAPDALPAETWDRRGLLTYANFHDPGGPWWQWEPSAHFFRHGLRQGELPFWDPYVGGGAPSMANMMPAYFFPPYLLIVLLGATPLLKNVYALALLFAAGLFTSRFLERHGVSAYGAAFGGLVLVCSGGINQAANSFIGQTACCLPFTLWVTRWFLDQPTWRRAALLALAYATVALASFPPVLVLVFGFAALYAAAMLAAGEIDTATAARRLAAGRYVAAVVLALGLVAFYYVPALLLVAISTQATAAYGDAARYAYPAASLLQLLAPDLLGGEGIFVNPPTRAPYPLSLDAFGISGLFLALLAAGGGPQRRSRLAWLAILTGLLLTLKLIGLPPVQWIAELPLLQHVHFIGYGSFLLHFLLALLAGIGCERLILGEVRPWRMAAAATILALALVAGYRAALGLGLPDHPEAFRWMFRWAVLWLLIAAVSCAAALAAYARGRGPLLRVAAMALLAIAAFEGVTNNAYPRQRRFDVWRHPVPYVRALQAATGDLRRYADYRDLPANTNSAFGLATLDSLMTFNSERVATFYQTYFGSDHLVFLRAAARLPPDPVLDASAVGTLAVRTAFSAIVTEARARGYRELFADDYAIVFARPAAPRFKVTPAYRVMMPGEALEGVGQPANSELLLLEEPPSFLSRPAEAEARVRVLFFHHNSYALETESPGPALVYCAESDMPGWSATVNGKPAAIRKANYAFRAVEIPPGHARVELRYSPPGWSLGLAVSALSLALALATCARPGRSAGAGQRTLTAT